MRGRLRARARKHGEALYKCFRRRRQPDIDGVCFVASQGRGISLLGLLPLLEKRRRDDAAPLILEKSSILLIDVPLLFRRRVRPRNIEMPVLHEVVISVASAGLPPAGESGLACREPSALLLGRGRILFGACRAILEVNRRARPPSRMGIDGDQRHTGDNCKTGQKSSRASHRQQPRPSLPRSNDSREKSLPCQPGLRFIPLLIFVGCGKATVRTPLPRVSGLSDPRRIRPAPVCGR